MGMRFLSSGLLTTVQDAGRRGYQRFGVPVSGAVDQEALTIANILVDNAPDEAALEITLMGPMIEFDSDCVIALAGADLSASLNGKPLASGKAAEVSAGDSLSFGAPRCGSRAYLAVAGGFDLEPVMGSRSTYLKAKMGGLEGRKIEKDDVISFREQISTLPHMAARTAKQTDFSQPEKKVRVILGPQNDAFTFDGIRTFVKKKYTVTPESDRMGMRLTGPAIEHEACGADIISDGISLGAVQVPGNGTPIIMLADRQTTGGYTKIATVITADLPLVAQSKPGDVISFEQVSVEQGEELYLEQRERFEQLRQQIQNGEVEQEQRTAVSKEEQDSPPATPKPAKESVPVPAIPVALPAAPGESHSYTIELNGRSFNCTVKRL